MKTFVRVFIVSTFVLWLVVDIVLALVGAPTESMIITEWAKATIALPFFVGFICGHWFIPLKNPWREGWPWALVILGLLIISDVMWNFFEGAMREEMRGALSIARFPAWWFLIGAPLGAILWAQPDRNSPL